MLTVFPTIRNREILILNLYRVSNYLCYYGKLLYYELFRTQKFHIDHRNFIGISSISQKKHRHLSSFKTLVYFGLGVLAESPKSVVVVATYDQVKKIVCVISKFA